MADRAFRALVAVELRRGLGVVGRGLAMTGAALLLFAVLGQADRQSLGTLLLGLTAFYMVSAPVTVTRDRLDGGLEFLASLPVSPGIVAGARLTGFALLQLPVPVHLSLAGWLWAWPALGLSPGLGTAGAFFLLTWALSVGITGVVSGVMVRWGADAFGRWPAILLALFGMAAVLMGGRFEAAIRDVLARLVAQAGLGTVVGGGSALLALVLLALAYRWLAVGVERFQPEPAKIQW
ncbi:MAG: hypothetical protein P8188_04205 [Gemmatimonadota bacterium]